MKHVPRVIAAHGMGAALHVNNACGHTFAGAVTGAPPETHSSEGGGVWGEYLPKAALTSNGLFLEDANVRVPVWLGGRGDRPAFPIERAGFLYMCKVTVCANKAHKVDGDEGTEACSSTPHAAGTPTLVALRPPPGV